MNSTAEPQIKTVFFDCPLCSQRIEAPESQLGAATVCPNCERGFVPPKPKPIIDAIKKEFSSDSDPWKHKVYPADMAGFNVRNIASVVLLADGVALFVDIYRVVNEMNAFGVWPTILIVDLMLYILAALMDIRDLLLRKK